MIEMDMGEVHLHLETESRLFSPAHPDQGTMAMLAAAAPAAGDKVLDLGCGYGLVGIYAAKVVGAGQVVMCDIDPQAVAVARRNAAANEVPASYYYK